VVRIAVSGEEALQADNVRSGRRPDQDDAASACLEQGHSPKDQRAHNPLAEIGLGDQQGRQSLRGYKQCLDLTLGRGVDQ